MGDFGPREHNIMGCKITPHSNEWYITHCNKIVIFSLFLFKLSLCFFLLMYFFNNFFTIHIVFLYSTHCLSLQDTLYFFTVHMEKKWCPSLDAERFGIEIVKETKEMKSPKASQKHGKKHAIWKGKKVEFVNSLFHIGDGEWTCVIRVSTFEYLYKTSPDIRGFVNVFHTCQVLVLGMSESFHTRLSWSGY